MPIIRVEEISKYEGQEVTIQGWVYNRTDKGKLVFLLVRDGTRLRPVRGVQGRPGRGGLRPARAPAAGIVGDHHRTRAGGQARARHPRRVRGRRQADPDRAGRRRGLPDVAQGPRRGLRARQPPPVDPHAEPVGDPARARHGHGCHPRVAGHATASSPWTRPS